MAQLNESHGRVKEPPRTDNINVLRDYVANLADMFAKLAKDLDFIINGNLDVKNIRANSITADRLKVDELSAISANLGHIISGLIEAVTIRSAEIYGSYIATNEGGFPRTEMSTEDNYFKVWLNETTFIEIIDQGEEGLPQIRLIKDGDTVNIGHGATLGNPYPGIYSSIPFILYAVGGFFPAGDVRFSNWSNVYDNNTGVSLQQELDDIRSSISTLRDAINSKADSGINTGSGGGGDGGIPIGTQLATAGGGTVTWVGISSHSHTQI